jgi:hypothetical protein
MLVHVDGVTASGATNGADFGVQPAGMCSTLGGLLITNDLADPMAPLGAATMCQTFTSITGVVYSFGAAAGPFDAKLAPRSSADVVTP